MAVDKRAFFNGTGHALFLSANGYFDLRLRTIIFEVRLFFRVL
jgi:hypothetical protein